MHKRRPGDEPREPPPGSPGRVEERCAAGSGAAPPRPRLRAAPPVMVMPPPVMVPPPPRSKSETEKNKRRRALFSLPNMAIEGRLTKKKMIDRTSLFKQPGRAIGYSGGHRPVGPALPRRRCWL